MPAQRQSGPPDFKKEPELKALWRQLVSFSREWRLTNLQWHELLPAWYVFSQLTEEDIGAARSSISTAPDGGVDAVHVGDSIVTLAQSKVRGSLRNPEDAAQIQKLTRWAGYLTADEDEFAAALHKQRVHESTAALLRKARGAVAGGKRLELHYLSTGNYPASRIEWEEAQTRAKETAAGPSVFRFIGGRQLLNLYDDYLVGVRAIPELSLPTRARTETALDGNRDVEMNLFLIPGDAIAAVVTEHGKRLFARNVRDYLGENRVNEAIEETLWKHPERFRFLNNGITIVCDDTEVVTKSGRSVLRLVNPQIVNGQQTSYSLEKVGEQSAFAEVLVKVVKIDRTDKADGQYQDIVHDLVFATNWQSKISRGDLRSSDPEQIELGRRLRQLDHYYARRTAAAGSLKSAAQGLPYLTRNQLADAVGGCLWESLPYREQKDNLYLNTSYYAIFDPSEAERDLVCHYLWKAVQRSAKDASVKRDRGKWLVLYFLHQTLGPELQKHSAVFIADGRATRGVSGLRQALQAVTKTALDAAERFYDAKSAALEEPTNFFRRKHLYPPHSVPFDDRTFDTPSFSDFLRSNAATPIRRRFQQRRKVLITALEKHKSS